MTHNNLPPAQILDLARRCGVKAAEAALVEFAALVRSADPLPPEEMRPVRAVDTLQSGAESALDLKKMPEYQRVREEFEVVSRIGADADIDSAMLNVNSLVAALARRATAPRPAPGVVTDAQISAGAEVLCDCPKPKRIGRSAAIDVFDAMSAAEPVEAAGSAVQDDLAAALNAAVDSEYPLPDSPHASVIQRATDNRAAMWRGVNAARKILATHPAEPVGAQQPDWKHVANEWADVAYNGLAWLRNVEDGISSVEKARENMELTCKHAKAVSDAAHAAEPAVGGALVAMPRELLERTHRVLSCAAIVQIRDGEKTWEDIGKLVATPNESAAAPADLSQAARDVLAERRRQVEQEGWTPGHDDDYADGQLSMAAACYATQGDSQNFGPPDDWPWNKEWWKPTDDRRNLVKAAALILADIERLDRATQPTGNAQ